MVTSDLINQFRDRVNKNNFVLNTYYNIGGKNLWNCICSAMDWITVAVDYLSSKNENYFRNMHTLSMDLFTYISSVDIIFESVKQLHRVFCNNKTIPFENAKGLFKNNKYCKDDNTYFKLIRACFGEHSVNLNDFFSGFEKEKRFASWSFGISYNGEFSVALYSNIPDVETIFMTIYIEEIDMFLEKTYLYLENLIDAINTHEKKFVLKFQQQKIAIEYDALKQIEILKQENDRRYKNDYYNEILDYLSLVFSTNISSADNLPIVNRYQKNTESVIKELYDAIQNMELREIQTYRSLKKIINVETSYSIRKALIELETEILDGNKMMIYISNLVKYIKPYVSLHGNESSKEIYLLAHSVLYFKSLES